MPIAGLGVPDNSLASKLAWKTIVPIVYDPAWTKSLGIIARHEKLFMVETF